MRENIKELRDKALSFIDLEIDLLLKLLNKPRVINKQKECDAQTFDHTFARELIKILVGEQKKLEELEMVLAVVGTMKAGKSTVINAIVGVEVLPNRNRPMTALPTLIRHTPGQVVPVLKFENDQPINRLLGELRKALKKSENTEIVSGISCDPYLRDVINFIRGRNKFQTRYSGTKAISQFLLGLNDLVRLSQKMDIAFPFSDYDEIHELPIIEVKFAHLRGASQSKGRLTLMDTPGPNESNQPHLRKMMLNQLRRASAVLAILDYTQLKSEADEEVRKEISDIASVTEGRLFTLVNKFDQKDRNGDSAEEVKRFVAESLMEGRIQSENVFPISAKWAYLSNRVRHELHVNKKLPDASKHAWVANFGEEAFGTRWELSNLIEVGASADLLWDDSLFHAPLESVIRTAHARAGVFSVASSVEKLIDVANNIQDIAAPRKSLLRKSIDELQPQIRALRVDVSFAAMNKKFALDFARMALQYLQDNFPNTLLWAQGINPHTFRNLREKQFLYSYCWVNYANGSSAADIKPKLPQLQEVFKNFEPNALSRMRSISPVLIVINNKRKAECFLSGAKAIHKEGFASFKRRLHKEGLKVLMGLPGIGAINKNYLAENIGLVTVSETDIWLKRAANLCDASSVSVLTAFLAESLHETQHVIEVAICKYGSDGRFEKYKDYNAPGI